MGRSAETILRNPRRMTAALGAAVTLVVLLLNQVGGLGTLRQWAFDFRVKRGQFFTPPPADDLVFVMIDDAAVQSVGRWPWPRHKLASMIDELNRSGAKVIAMDIIFPEEQAVDVVKDEQGRYTEIDNDRIFADAIARHGKIVVGRDGTPTPDDVEVIPIIEKAAAYTGSVKYRAGDKRLRSVPLLYTDPHTNEKYFHSSVALAALMNDSDPNVFTDIGEDVRMVTKRGRIHIPGITVDHKNTAVENALSADAYVPWFGRPGAEQWETMFDWPKHESGRDQFISAKEVWDSAQDYENKRAVVFADIRQGMLNIQSKYTWTEWAMPAEDASTQEMIAAAKRTLMDITPWLEEEYADESKLTEEQVDERAELLHAKEKLEQFITVRQDALERRARFKDKAIIIGQFQTGAAGGAFDTVQTPLHSICPGPVVLGAMYSAIQTRNFWVDAPAWVTILITLCLGLTMTWIAATQGPIVTSGSALSLAVVYGLVNVFALFDYGNVIVGLASPLTALVLVWVGCTVFRFVFERVERNRITRRFRSYVDPALVDYVLEHPEKTTLDGEERELTVVFTDLAGFTSISEKLGEQTVTLVSEYLGRMVPIIQEQNGYVNKFLGDGMMFFYGAPRDNEGHAIDAVLTVLRMQQSLSEFNKTLETRDLPELGMRAGIGTGEMVVGDAGPADRCDYTVLGDTVNLSARLESANKATGTWIMMNERTKDLIGDRFLVRPIANLQVVGKSEGVRVFEPLAVMDEATEQQKNLAEKTIAMVAHYGVGKFEKCIRAIDDYENAFGPGNLTELYREQCEHFLKNPPEMPFDDRIVLTEK